MAHGRSQVSLGRLEYKPFWGIAEQKAFPDVDVDVGCWVDVVGEEKEEDVVVQ